MEICGGLSCGYPFLAGLTDVGGCLLSLTGQFLHVFDRLGRCFSFLDLGFSPGFILICTDGQFLWTVFTAFYSGWLAAPLTHLLLGLWLVFSRDANPGWGDWCRSRGGWGVCFVFVFWFLAIVKQRLCL